MNNILPPPYKKLLYYLIVLIILFLTIFIIGELSCRFIFEIHPTVKSSPSPPYNTAQKDDELGWKMTPNYTYLGEMLDAKKQKYPINIKYDENGFKAYGNVNSLKKKVFFIGDSYTASIEASNENTFYNLLKDSLDIEVFAYGQAGYGTMQEYLIFKKYLPIIKPDVVVWQTSANDFIDNHTGLEKYSGYKVGERRPYVSIKGKIEYKRAISVLDRLAEKSGFMSFIKERWKNIDYNYLNKNRRIAEYWIGEIGKEYEPFAESVKLTEVIFDKVKEDLPEKTKLVGFSAGIFEPQASTFKEIFERRGFPYSIEPALMVEKRKWKEVVHAKDRHHWNNRGQELVASTLIPLLNKVGINSSK